MTQPLDLTDYADDDLTALRLDIIAEQQRRITVTDGPGQVDDLIAAYSAATRRADGASYVPPTSAIDAYPLGATVTVDGVTWESLIPANTTTPGDPNDGGRWWKNVTDQPVAGAWDGDAHGYKVGDTVTYQGHNYTAIQANTSQPGWDPVSVPALWKDNGPV